MIKAEWTNKDTLDLQPTCNQLATTEEDTISRQDAIDAIAKFVPYVIDDISTESYTNGLRDAYNLIYQLPSVDRPTGEWIFNPKDAIESMFTLPKCSKCGFESSDGGNFCSNCGAKMLREDNKEYELATEQMEHDALYEPTYNPEDGSM